jgi:hypothetical protein
MAHRHRQIEPRQIALGQQPRARAAFAQDEPLAGHLGRTDRVPAGQRMVGRRDQHMRMVGQRPCVGQRLTRGAAHDAQVELAPAQAGDGLGPVRDLQHHLDIGEFGIEQGDQPRRKILGRADRPQHDAAGLTPVERIDDAKRAVKCRTQLRLGPDQLGALRGQRRAAAPLAEHQGGADRVFQRFQLAVHRRAGQPHGLGGPRYGALFGDQTQRAKLPERDVIEAIHNFSYTGVRILEFSYAARPVKSKRRSKPWEAEGR